MAKTTTLEYVGPHQGEVVVNLDQGPTRTHGRLIEVSAAEAKKLLAQPDNWQKTLIDTARDAASEKEE